MAKIETDPFWFGFMIGVIFETAVAVAVILILRSLMDRR